MCLLIAQPRGVSFSKKDLTDYLSYNADGVGYAYAERGVLQVIRIVGDEKEAIRAYHAHVAGKKALLHFRMATHGTCGIENCHPFHLTPEIVVAHNGILSIEANDTTGASDTRLFVEHVLQPMALQNPDALFTPVVRDLLGDLIGPSNRLMFLRADGRQSIVNASMGVLHKTAWLSNTYAWSSPQKAHEGWAQSAWSKPGRYTTTGVVHVPATVVARPIDPDDGLEVLSDDSDELLILGEDVAQAWRDTGNAGVCEWVRRNLDDARRLLIELYDLDDGQATALAVSDVPEAAKWLIDVVIDPYGNHEAVAV